MPRLEIMLTMEACKTRRILKSLSPKISCCSSESLSEFHPHPPRLKKKKSPLICVQTGMIKPAFEKLMAEFFMCQDKRYLLIAYPGLGTLIVSGISNLNKMPLSNGK